MFYFRSNHFNSFLILRGRVALLDLRANFEWLHFDIQAIWRTLLAFAIIERLER